MTSSWRLKLDRAEHHLKEVNHYVAAYTKPHPYESIRLPDLRRKSKRLIRFGLKFTAEPDERLAIVVGDLVHNVRSALDHIITSMAPNSDLRSKVAFFIFQERPYDANGDPLDTEDGTRWGYLKTVMTPDALTQIDLVQPYNPPEPDVLAFCAQHVIRPVDLHGQAVLNKLDNGDKHRRLITVGILDGTATITMPNGEKLYCPLDGMTKDGAPIIILEFDRPVGDSEVKVEVDGTPVVAIEVIQEKGAIRIPRVLERMIDDARGLCASLERLTGVTNKV